MHNILFTDHHATFHEPETGFQDLTNPYVHLRELAKILLDMDIYIYSAYDKHTPSPDVIIDNVAKKRKSSKPHILLRLEPPCNSKNNWTSKYIKHYNKVGSYAAHALKPTQWFYFGYPWIPKFNVSTHETSEQTILKDKNIDFMLIAGNKLPNHYMYSPACLAPLRYSIIKYFEHNHTKSFQLFGHGWNLGLFKPNYSSKIKKKLANYLPLLRQKIVNNYQGTAKSKFSVIKNSKFVFCPENYFMDGYFTEKLPDVLSAGSIPIYLGDPKLHALPPKNKPFIDILDYDNLDHLVEFCLNLDGRAYLKMLNLFKSNLLAINFQNSPASLAASLTNALSAL